MRKDIYLSVCEATYAGLTAIGKFSNLDINKENILEEYLDKAAAISKVRIIAREDTIRAVTDVVGEMSSSIIRLTTKRMPLILLQKHLAQLNAQILEFGKERDRWLEAMKQYNLSGTIDPRRWHVMDVNFKFEQQRVHDCQEKMVGAVSSLCAGQLDFTNECVSELCKINETIVPAVMAMRGELGITTQKEEFSRIFSENIGRHRIMLDKFFEDIKKQQII